MDVHPKFPVALINNGGVGGYSSPENLQICSERAIDEKMMIGARIVDIEGKQFVIQSATKIKNLNWLPSFLVAYDRRISEADFELSENGRLSVDEFKLLVVDTVKDDEVFRDTGLLRMIKGSETFYEIIECIGID